MKPLSWSRTLLELKMLARRDARQLTSGGLSSDRKLRPLSERRRKLGKRA